MMLNGVHIFPWSKIGIVLHGAVTSDLVTLTRRVANAVTTPRDSRFKRHVMVRQLPRQVWRLPHFDAICLGLEESHSDAAILRSTRKRRSAERYS